MQQDLPQPLARWNPTRDCWETTQQASLLSEHLDVFLATWPASGMTRSGTAYELPTLAPLMAGSGSSSLLPTPRTSDTNGAGLHGSGGAGSADGSGEPVALLPTPTTRDTKGHNQRGDATCLTGALLPTPSVADTQGGRKTRSGARSGELLLNGIADQQAWGPYTAAIARWERINGPAPAPTKLGKKGRPKLNPEFAAWMMGCSPGWITDVPDVTDNEALRMAGNGVVRQQAEFALRIMADRFTQWSNQ